jgi:hypothetical protein
MKRALLCLLLAVTACACSAQRLRCDGPLQPINPVPTRQAAQGPAEKGEVHP